jgi:hypothetical protein
MNNFRAKNNLASLQPEGRKQAEIKAKHPAAVGTASCNFLMIR